jgi:hypothetical protein
MDRALKIVHRINATYLEDKFVVDELGEQLVKREDFDSPHDVLPVSDPNIFCELQRYGQMQTLQELLPLYQGVLDPRKVLMMLLKQMKLPNDGQDLLIPKPEPQQLNPVNENIAVTLGRPIVAFPAQDHEAHLQAHCDWIDSPLFAAIGGTSPQTLGGYLQHFKEHIAFWYGTKVHEIASKAAKHDIGDLPQNDEEDPEVGQKYDQMLAEASVHVMQAAQQSQPLLRALQCMQKLQQALKAVQPPPMMDPTQAAMADVQRQSARDKQDAQLKGQQIQQQGQESQAENQAKLQQTVLQEQGDLQRAQIEAATKQETTQEDNATAIAIKAHDAVTGAANSSNVTDGQGVGKSAPQP